MAINDQQYIDNLLAGDQSAFRVLITRYQDMVYTLCKRMMRQQEDAEEAAQDAFVKAYRSIDRFKGDSKFSTWLYRITYNTCLDRLKKRKRQWQNVSMDAYTLPEVHTLDNALQRMEAKERQAAVLNCINQLSAEDAFLLTMYYYEDQSLDEIAKIMEIKYNHVKIKLHRSRKKLAVILESQLDNETLGSYGTAFNTAL